MYKRILFAIACLSFFTGCENEKISIPDSLNGTTWLMSQANGTDVFLDFEADICTIYQTLAMNSEQGPVLSSEKQVIVTYAYRFVRPSVELLKDAETILSGEVVTDGESYLLMELHDADNTITTSFFNVKK